MNKSYDEVLLEFRQAVSRSISDAQRVPQRDPRPSVNARAVWESCFKDVLHESVLDEYTDDEAISG